MRINKGINAVYGGMFNDNCVGFRCRQCGGVFKSMWGETCNGCRKSNKQHKELIEALRGEG